MTPHLDSNRCFILLLVLSTACLAAENRKFWSTTSIRTLVAWRNCLRPPLHLSTCHSE